jgi:hypothetical protein
VPAAIAEGVELLDVADRERRLFVDKGAKRDLEGAVRERIELAGGRPIRPWLSAPATRI